MSGRSPAIGKLQAPDWQIAHWLNATQDFSLASLRGRVVLLHAFQMLCPGCVLHGIPQAQRVQAAFPPEQVVVVGLHSVFEHHAVMNRAALEAFVHEYRLTFPIGIDQPGGSDPIPQTMRRYAMRGTPTTILIDRQGAIALHEFGRPDDLRLGATIGRLLAGVGISEAAQAMPQTSSKGVGACDESACAL